MWVFKRAFGIGREEAGAQVEANRHWADNIAHLEKVIAREHQAVQSALKRAELPPTLPIAAVAGASVGVAVADAAVEESIATPTRRRRVPLKTATAPKATVSSSARKSRAAAAAPLSTHKAPQSKDIAAENKAPRKPKPAASARKAGAATVGRTRGMRELQSLQLEVPFSLPEAGSPRAASASGRRARK